MQNVTEDLSDLSDLLENLAYDGKWKNVLFTLTAFKTIENASQNLMISGKNMWKLATSSDYTCKGFIKTCWNTVQLLVLAYFNLKFGFCKNIYTICVVWSVGS